MSRNRAWRRHQKQRTRAKAQRVLQVEGAVAHDAIDPSRAARLADHLAVCSCFMCGNPRRHFGLLTISERREELTRQEALHAAWTSINPTDNDLLSEAMLCCGEKDHRPHKGRYPRVARWCALIENWFH